MRSYHLAMIILGLAASLAQADPSTEKVDAFVSQQLQSRHIPGISVGILQDGKVLLATGFGFGNVELSTPATADTVYGVMSMTKQFTAAAILMLADENKLALDDQIGKYVSDAPTVWNDVTIRHLLTHTSGIPDYTDAPGFFQAIRTDSTPQELIQPLKSKPLQFPPGTKWRYSNTNYYLLGIIIEKASGASFGRFIDARIFQPAGMAASRLNDLTDVIPNRASGYQWIGENVDRPPTVVTGYHGRKNVLQNAIYISPTRLWAAGGAVSSVNDLIRWEQTLAAGKLLKAETVQEMSRACKLPDGKETEYGFGNELGVIKGHHFSGHQGSGVGFNSSLLRLDDDHITVIVLCNQTSAPSLPIAMQIAGIFVPDLQGIVPQ
ncbi:MAG: beta-lactamase family protein [Planctomycetota bacterium]|nr:beta-lactamase family protein [Planctomycetota bacterium]